MNKYEIIREFQNERTEFISESEWKKYVNELAELIGFYGVVFEEGNSDIYIDKTFNVNNLEGFGKVIVGSIFWTVYRKICVDSFSMFKKYIEAVLIHEAGHMLSPEMVYQYDEAIATISGFEHLGYPPFEISTLLSNVVAVDYFLCPGKLYFADAREKYNHQFFDFFTAAEVDEIISRAEQICLTACKKELLKVKS